MLELFGVIAGILAPVASIPYIKDILHHKTKPHRITWFTFSILASIAFFSQLAKGASNSLWLPGVLAIDVFILFLLSLKWSGRSHKKRSYSSYCYSLRAYCLVFYRRSSNRVV